MALSPQVVNLILVLSMIPISKKIDFNDPVVLNGCRAAYLISNLLIAGIYMYIQSSINKKNDKTVLTYVEPPPMGSTEPGKHVQTTIRDYDTTQLRNSFRSQLMGVAMMGFMHLYMKYTNPLVLQSIIPLKGALESNLAKIHVFNNPASGELKRPWKQAAGFLGAMSGGQPQTDKKTVEAAERAGRGGAKEE
jgi:hypothetical protein